MAQVLRKALKISKPLPLVSGEPHLLGGLIFSVKSWPVPGFSGGSEYSVTPVGIGYLSVRVFEW